MPVSRRRFAAVLSAGTAAVLSANFLRADETRLRAAVIGHTGRGDYGHSLEQIFQGRSGVELIALADPDATGRARTARTLGVNRTYADWRELLRLETPQVVVVAQRHADQHGEIVLACVEAGAHVFVEKPFVRSPDEADVILAAAARKKRKIAVAHTMRMMPVVEQFRKKVEDGLLGELVELRAFGKQDTRAGGEDMMVLGTHLFDLMRLFLGDPRWCSARVLVDGRDITVADRRLVKDDVGWVAGDQVTAIFAFDRGINATFTSDARLREMTGHWGLEFRGTKGVAKLNCDLSPTVFLRTTTPWSAEGRREEWTPLDPALVKNVPVHTTGPVTDWLEAIAQDREPEGSGRDGAWAVEMVSAVYQSALRGGRVTFPLQQRQHPLAK